MKVKKLTLCLLCQDNQVLLGMKKRGFGAGRWNGFGGKLEQGESLEQAAIREFKEEANIDVEDIEERGILEFEFDGSDEILEVHVFKATKYTGTPIETEEMRPKWFDIDAIPFADMWQDDIYWFPLFFQNKSFKGKFYFNTDDELISHNLEAI